MPVHHLYCPKKCILESYNEAFKDSTRSGYAGGGLFASVGAMADDSVFTVMDDPSAAKKPFEGVVTQATGAVRQHQELFDDGGFHPDLVW